MTLLEDPWRTFLRSSRHWIWDGLFYRLKTKSQLQLPKLPFDASSGVGSRAAFHAFWPTAAAAVCEAVGDKGASHVVAALESWELLGEAFVEEVGLGSSLLPRSTRSSFADRTRCPVPGNPDESWTDTPDRYAHFSIKYKYVRPGTHLAKAAST